MIRGRTDFDKLLRIHPIHSAAEAFFAVSLAGSLFFNVSVDAARPRILLYLALTMAPFALLAPLIGPLIDRVRGGPRIALSITLASRGVLAMMLATQLRTLALFPLAFGIMVLGRTYSVARIAMVPSLVHDPERLVAANARLALIGTIGGTLGGVAAVGVLAATSAPWVLRTAAVVYLVGAILATRLPLSSEHGPDAPVQEYLELHDSVVQATTLDMAALRAAVGFLFFHLGFVLKSEGAPTWFFGLVLAASSLGGFSGNILAPWVRKHLREQPILTVSLIMPAAAAFVAGLRLHAVTVVVLVIALGLSASLARRAYDSVVQIRAPHARQGRAYAWLETRLEVAWVLGAFVAVAGRLRDWVGLMVLAVALGLVALLHRRWRRTWVRLVELQQADPLAERLLRTAEQLASQGDNEQSVITATAAAEIASAASTANGSNGALGELKAFRDGVLAGAVPQPGSALRLARQVLAGQTD